MGDNEKECKCHDCHVDEVSDTCIPDGIVTSKIAVEGLDCMDCAAKLEQRVKSLKGVKAVRFDVSTAMLIVSHEGPRSEIVSVIKDSGYSTPEGKPTVTVYEILHLECADCIAKFEKALRNTPGIVNIKLDFGLARLTVEHTIPSNEVIKVASDIGFNIRETGIRKKENPLVKHSLAITTAISGVLTGAGFIAGQLLQPEQVIWSLFLLAVVIGGARFAKSAFYSIRTLTPDMYLLMTLAIIGAIAIGEVEEAATVTFLFSLGMVLQSYTLDRTRHSIKELISLSPKEASVLRDGKEERLNIELIKSGDVILVRPGEKIAMDGEVLSGISSVNQAPITGESIPVEKISGSEVYAGTINGLGPLEVRVTKAAEDNTINRIIHMVEEAQANKAPSQELVDRFSKYYTPLVISLSIGIAIIPVLLGQPFVPWLQRALVLLVISCPCALVISTPVSIVAAIGNASRNGVLVKGGSYLETIGRTRAVAFDKTGTLTEGKPAVVDVVLLDGCTQEQALSIASALESKSEHPFASAIIAANGNDNKKSVEDFETITGKGIRGKVNGVEYRIGNEKMFVDGTAGQEARDIMDRLQGEGKTPILLGTDSKIIAVIAISDRVRPDSALAVSGLHKAGIKEVVMLTGDNERVAKAISDHIGLDGYQAGLLPQDKVAGIKKLMDRNGEVIMVGDGINDAPALAAASVGIAMGATGSDTALETADVALMSNDLLKVDFAIRLGRKTLSIIKQNITMSVLIKAVFISLAVFGMATLWMAVFADVGASLLVTLNGMRLLRVK